MAPSRRFPGHAILFLIIDRDGGPRSPELERPGILQNHVERTGHSMQASRPSRWMILLTVIGLAALVYGVFSAILGFDFVRYDVYDQVTDNPHIQGLTWENIRYIFRSKCVTSYYPIRTLTYAIDYEIWGLDATGFKLTNGLIHLANVLLIFWLVLRFFDHAPAVAASCQLAGRGQSSSQAGCLWPRSTAWEVLPAASSAALFAVHPVVVEPVAWVAGREELLMVLGTLGCIHCHVTARRLSDNGGGTRWIVAWHASAAFCCVVACLSNAVSAVIPVLIVAWDALALYKPTLWRILSGTAALWLIGMATFAIKKIAEFVDLVDEAPVFSAERLMAVLNAYGENLKTLVWPVHLTADYRRVFPESFAEIGVLSGALALGLTAVLLWKVRRRKMVLFGLIWFGVALGPSAQIMPHHIYRADRFLYLPLVGLVVAFAMAVGPFAHVMTRRAKTAAAVLAVLVLLLLSVGSTRQIQTWRSRVSLWENCVKVSPEYGLAHCFLAESLAEHGPYRRAIRHYEEALRLMPSDGRPMSHFAVLLATCEDKELRDYDRAMRLAMKAYLQGSEYLRELMRVYQHVARDLAERGEYAQAIDRCNVALELNPKSKPVLLELATLLATCRDQKLRNPAEAVRLAERACELGEPPTAAELSVLATAYAAARRFDEAVTTVNKAIALTQASGDAELADELLRRLDRYRNGILDITMP